MSPTHAHANGDKSIPLLVTDLDYAHVTQLWPLRSKNSGGFQVFLDEVIHP